PGPEILRVNFDDGYRVCTDHPFHYQIDPEVRHVDFLPPIDMPEAQQFSSATPQQAASISSAAGRHTNLISSHHSGVYSQPMLMDSPVGLTAFDGLTALRYVSYGAPTRRPYPKGIPSGGIPVYVTGRNFSIIQRPQIYVELAGKTYNGSCELLSDTRLRCQSPSVPA